MDNPLLKAIADATRPVPKPKPNPVVPPRGNPLLRAIDPGYARTSGRQTYTQQQRRIPGTIQSDMANADRVLGANHPNRELIRSALTFIETANLPKPEHDRMVSRVIDQARQGDLAPIAGFVNERRAYRSWYESNMGDLRARAEAGLTPDESKASMSGVSPLAKFFVGNQPNIENDSNGMLYLRSLSAVMNQPVSIARVGLTGDSRQTSEMGPLGIAEEVGNFLAPMILPGGAATKVTDKALEGLVAKGAEGAANVLGRRLAGEGVGMAAKVAGAGARSLATDVPGFAVGIHDAGGVQPFLSGMGRQMSDALDASKTPFERWTGAIAIAGIGLGAYAGGHAVISKGREYMARIIDSGDRAHAPQVDVHTDPVHAPTDLLDAAWVSAHHPGMIDAIRQMSSEGKSSLEKFRSSTDAAKHLQDSILKGYENTYGVTDSKFNQWAKTVAHYHDVYGAVKIAQDGVIRTSLGEFDNVPAYLDALATHLHKDNPAAYDPKADLASAFEGFGKEAANAVKPNPRSSRTTSPEPSVFVPKEMPKREYGNVKAPDIRAGLEERKPVATVEKPKAKSVEKPVAKVAVETPKPKPVEKPKPVSRETPDAMATEKPVAKVAVETPKPTQKPTPKPAPQPKEKPVAKAKEPYGGWKFSFDESTGTVHGRHDGLISNISFEVPESLMDIWGKDTRDSGNGYMHWQNNLIKYAIMSEQNRKSAIAKRVSAKLHSDPTPVWSDPNGDIVRGQNRYVQAHSKANWEPLNESARRVKAKQESSARNAIEPRWPRTPKEHLGKDIYVFAARGNKKVPVAGPFHTHQEAIAASAEIRKRLSRDYRDADFGDTGLSYGAVATGEAVKVVYPDIKSEGENPFRKHETPTPKPVSQPKENPVAKAKEPWEMTRKEYFAIRKAEIDDRASRMGKRLGRVAKWDKDFNARSDAARWHKNDVQKALSEGKPVPAEVLADYPDLQPKPVGKGVWGSTLSDQQKWDALTSLDDSYRGDNPTGKEALKHEITLSNGRTKEVYMPYQRDKMNVSDHTGSYIRHSINTPYGRAHPSELFPDLTEKILDAIDEAGNTAGIEDAAKKAGYSDSNWMVRKWARKSYSSSKSPHSVWINPSAKPGEPKFAYVRPSAPALYVKGLLANGWKIRSIDIDARALTTPPSWDFLAAHPDWTSSAVKDAIFGGAWASDGVRARLIAYGKLAKGRIDTSKPKPAKFEPKADPNYQAGDVPDIRKGLKPVQKPAATQKEPAPQPKPGTEAPVAKVDPKTKKHDVTGIQDFGEHIAGSRKDTAKKLGTIRKGASTPVEPTGLPNHSVYKRYVASEVVSKNSSDSGKWAIRDTRQKSAFQRPVGRKLFDTKAEAERMIPILAVAEKHSVKEYEPGKFAIVRRVGDKYVAVKAGFDSHDAAMMHMATHPLEVIDIKPARYDEFDYLEKVVRTGPTRRAGDVKPVDFQRDFAFRGGQFGKWNLKEYGQASLNHAYDALHDLADVTGLGADALSMKGDLGIAFGARGHGNTGWSGNVARAHYEPGERVINLTREKGAGALAHEWIHALDNYYGAKAGDKSGIFATTTRKLDSLGEVGKAWEKLRDALLWREKVIPASEMDRRRAENLSRYKSRVDERLKDIRSSFTYEYKYGRGRVPTDAELKAFDEISKRISDGEYGEKTTFESKARYANTSTYESVKDLNAIYRKVKGHSILRADGGSGNALSSAISDFIRLQGQMKSEPGGEGKARTASQFVLDAREADKVRGSAYYSLNEELLARAFQGYVRDKLQAKGHESQYLNTGGRETSAHVDIFGKPVYIFPRGDERIAINKAFDNLFDAVKEDLGTPRTSADALADAKAAIQDFKDAPGPKGVKGGKQTGSAMIPISPKQAEALGRAVKHFVEAGHLKLEEVVSQVRQAMGSAWHDGLRPHIEKIFTELTGGGKVKESGNAPRSTEATKTAPSKPPTREAVGPARRFQDVLAEGRGEESAPTNPSASPKVLADAGLKAYSRDKSAVAYRVQEIVRGNSKITRDDIPKITAYMRDVYNEFNKAIANPATPENVLTDLGKTIDDIKLASSYGSGEFHKWGMAMQTAFEPDFSPAELLSTARKISEGYKIEPMHQAALEYAGKKWQEASARIKELESEVERLIASKDTGQRAPARGTRSRALYNLKKLGFEVTENVAPVGSKRTKQTGSVDILSVTPDQYKAIWDFVRSEISENGYKGFDDLMERVNKVLPQVTKEMVYGAASGEYRAFDAQKYLAQRNARKTLAAVRASVAYRSMPKVRRIGANVMESLNLPRVLKASTDLSAPFIQGRPILMSHPVAWFKAWKPMLEAIKKGPDAVEAQLAKIEQHPLYPILKKAGLDLTEIGGSYHAQEEAYAGHLLPRAYEKGGLIGAGVTPLIHSDAAFAAFMDAARWNVARGLMAMDSENLAWAKDVAQYTNIISGRGHGKIARMLGSSPLPGMAVFAPRYRLSKWQMAFEPLRVWFSYETTAGKKLALKSWTHRAIFMATTAALINATKDKTGASIDVDPRSSRLGWVSLPDGQQVDLFGTMNDPLRALFSQFYGHVSVKGNYTEPGGFGSPTMTDELTKGSAPVGSMLNIAATGQLYDQRTGENINATTGNVARNLLVPMSLDSIIDRAQNGEPPSKAVPMAAMDMLGFNSNPLRNQNPKSKPPPLDLRVLPGWNRKPKKESGDQAARDLLKRLSSIGGSK